MSTKYAWLTDTAKKAMAESPGRYYAHLRAIASQAHGALNEAAGRDSLADVREILSAWEEANRVIFEIPV